MLEFRIQDFFFNSPVENRNYLYPKRLKYQCCWYFSVLKDKVQSCQLLLFVNIGLDTNSNNLFMMVIPRNSLMEEHHTRNVRDLFLMGTDC